MDANVVKVNRKFRLFIDFGKPLLEDAISHDKFRKKSPFIKEVAAPS